MSGSDLFTGTLDILIPMTPRGGQPHGHGIGRAIRDRSGGMAAIPGSTPN